MPFTIPDGLPFEQEGDTPGRTLDGAGDTSPILAEEVQRVITELREATQQVQEAAERGWRPIADGDEGTLSFAVPSGVSMVRVHLVGQLSSSGLLTFTCNNADVSDWEVNYIRLDPASDGAVNDADALDGETFVRFGSWSGRTATAGFTILGLDGSSTVRPWHGFSRRQRTGAGNFPYQEECHGRTSSAAPTVESVQLVARNATNTGANTFSQLNWWAEGYRP